MIIEL